MISTANLTMQFGAKPLFENVSVKFGGGNRYGLIGANGSGKSTFMKILGGELEPSSGQVMLAPDVRLGKLRQDQFAYEDFTVLDTVIMGHERLWQVHAERERIYSKPEMSEEDGMAVGELENEYAELDAIPPSPGRGTPPWPWHSAGTAQRPHERNRTGLEAAGSAGPGAVLGPGCIAAG